MARFIRLPEIPQPIDSNDLVEFDEKDEKGIHTMWMLVLAIAIRDNAISIHWQPWRNGRALSYVVDDVRYYMIPSPKQFDDQVSRMLQSLIAPTRIGLALRRFLGMPITGRILCESKTTYSEWSAVAWKVGDIMNVDFYRLDIPISPLGIDRGYEEARSSETPGEVG